MRTFFFQRVKTFCLVFATSKARLKVRLIFKVGVRVWFRLGLVGEVS